MADRNNFHFVRLVAASLVVTGHSYELLGCRPPVWFDVSVSAFAVRIFFVVSGYLICDSWSRDPNLYRYLVRRLLRIIPALAVVVGLCALVLGPLMTTLAWSNYFSAPQVVDYFWNVALAPRFQLPGVFEANPLVNAVNGSLWTLPAEFAMYLFLPLCGTAGSLWCRYLLMPVAILGFGGAGVFYALRPETLIPIVWSTSVPQVLRWAPYFMAGAAFRVWRLERFLNLHVAIVGLALCAALFDNPVARNLSLIVVTPYVVLAVCLVPNLYLERLGRHADISYGVYLYAFPLQQALIALVGRSLHPLVLLGVAMPVSWLLGYVSWHVVEKHALRLKPRRPKAPLPNLSPKPTPLAVSEL